MNNMEETLKYVEYIGKILSIGISVYTIVWAIFSVVQVQVEKMKLAIENKDWESMINIVNEFVLAAEEKFLNKSGCGKDKKQMVINLLEQAGYEVTEVVDALIESAVYQQFNAYK
jgi:Ethanolamine utilization protein EutJ (predicted chaperonin)